MPGIAVNCYEKMMDGLLEAYFRPFAEEVLRTFPGPARILDIGTGTGQLPIMLARSNSNYEITAIDLSRRCIDTACSKAEAAGVSCRLAFARADILSGQCHTEPFDLIVTTCSLHHWRSPVQMLRAARRLLKDQGQIWIMDDDAEATSDARQKWVRKVEQACNPGWISRAVFTFESRFLAYSRWDLECLCKKADLQLMHFSTREVFFTAWMIPTRLRKNNS